MGLHRAIEQRALGLATAVDGTARRGTGGGRHGSPDRVTGKRNCMPIQLSAQSRLRRARGQQPLRQQRQVAADVGIYVGETRHHVGQTASTLASRSIVPAAKPWPTTSQA